MKRTFLIFCIAALLCMTALAMTGMASDNWSPDSFTNHYRVFVNGTSTTLSDYQVKLVLHNDTGDNMAENIYLPGIIQPNYNDVRFALNDGTQLNYWMETPTGTDNATFWIKIPSIPQGTENSVAVDIYYGNSTIGSGADGDATFPLFDDFDGTGLNTSKWTVTSGTTTISNSQLTFKGNPVKIYSNKQFQNNASVSVYGLPSTMKQIGFSSIDQNNYCFMFTNPSIYVYTNSAGSKSTTEKDGSLPSTSVIYNGMWNTTKFTIKVGSNPIAVGKYNPVVALPVFLGSQTGTSSAVYDWIFVRQLVDVEPTIYTPPVVPVADFSANVTNGTVPLTVKFTDKSTYFPTVWAWDFNNDGVVDSTTQSPSYTYSEPGNYSVNLTVTGPGGSNSMVKPEFIVVGEQAPEAAFTADIKSGTAPLTVNFTDQSTGHVTSWNWDFGENSTASDQNPSHTYVNAGNYTVNLTVGNAGGSNSMVKPEYIVVGEPLPPAPVANFSAVPTSGNAPLKVQFTDTSTGSVSSYAWDFNNDGIVDSTEQNPVFAYTAAGNYTVNLTVANVGGSNSMVKPEYIVVGEPLPGAPVAAFSAAPTSGNSPLTVKYTDASTGTISSYAWDFNNDGTVDSTEQSPSYTYGTAGKYTVNLTVTGPGGSDSEVKTEFINVNSPVTTKPVAAFSASSTLGIMPLNVQFTDQSTGVPTSWSWSFGDGNTSTQQNPAHMYSKVGKFTVSLTVKNKLGSNTAKKTSYIDVEVVPVADFSASKTLGKAPLSVKFTDKSTGAPTSWNWNFGDGTNSTEKSPTHVYNAVGKYNVTLTATNTVGNNTMTKSSYIDVEGVPVANFSANSTLGIMPFNVSFTDLSIGVPTSWSWKFGDGNTSTQQNPSHIYSKVGKFTVSLTAKNAVGSNTITKTKYIDVEIVPIADFTASKTLGKAPLSVKFTDKSTGAPTNWTWNFGDGSTSTEKTPTHVYNAVGKYTVTLTATNAVGNNSITKSKYIDVEGVPVANFSANSTVGAVPFNVSLTDLSTGVPTSWSWSFGDGNTSTQQNPSHVYSKGGQYTVKLTAKNAVGSNSITKTKLITVESIPVASFSASPTSGKQPMNVTFTDKSTGYPESWNWDFGDGTNSTEQKPVHTYSAAGKYTVNLKVTNLAGSNKKSMFNYIKVS